MASTRENVTGRVSVGRGAADLCRAAILVRRFIFFYFVCMVLQRFRRNPEASWTIFSCASKLQVAEANEQQCESAFKLQEGLNEDSAPENQLAANETAQRESPTVAALPTLPSHSVAFDSAGNMPFDVEKRNWIRKTVLDAGDSDRERPGDEQPHRLLRRQLSGIHTPLDLPTDSPSVSSEPESLHKQSQFVHSLEGAMQHGQKQPSTMDSLHKNTINAATPFSKRWRPNQNDPPRIARPLRLNESRGNLTGQTLVEDRHAGLQTFRGRLLQTINLSCRTLPGLPLQDTAAFREVCSCLCQTACANAADQRRSISTQRPAFGALQLKLQKAILNFLRASVSQQPQLLQQACQKAFQQFRQQRGIEQLLPFGGSIPDLYPGATFASSSLASVTTSASSAQVSSAGDDHDMHLLPVDASQSVSLPSLSTDAGEPRQPVTPAGRPSTAVATSVFLDNEIDNSSTSSTVETGPVLPSFESFANGSEIIPPTETVATDAPAELLFSPELLENTELSEASSAPRSLTGTAEGDAARQHLKADEEAGAAVPMQRNLQQGLFWQRFIPSGIFFEPNAPRTHSSGSLETMSTSVLFPRTRISWSTEDGVQDGLSRPVQEGQWRYALESSGERERQRNDQQQRRGVDSSEKQSPNQLTTPELEDVRVQLTGVLYEILQHLLENPTEVRPQLEKERRQRGPASNAHQARGQGRGGTQTESKDSKAQMLVDGSNGKATSAISGADGPQGGA